MRINRIYHTLSLISNGFQLNQQVLKQLSITTDRSLTKNCWQFQTHQVMCPFSSVVERWSCKPAVMSSILIGGILRNVTVFFELVQVSSHSNVTNLNHHQEPKIGCSSHDFKSFLHDFSKLFWNTTYFFKKLRKHDFSDILSKISKIL